MPDESKAAERVSRAIFQSVTDIVQQMESDGDQEALAKIGPTLLTIGIMLISRDIGRHAAARVIRELGPRIERGEFDGSLEHMSRVSH